MAPLDRSYTTSYQLAIVSIALSCIVSEILNDVSLKSGLRFIQGTGN